MASRGLWLRLGTITGSSGGHQAGRDERHLPEGHLRGHGLHAAAGTPHRARRRQRLLSGATTKTSSVVSGTAVYRLYVGVTNRPPERWGSHANKPWWSRVVRIEITRDATRDEASRIVAAAIRGEQPLHNQVIPNADGSVRGAHLREDSPALATRRGPRTRPARSTAADKGKRVSSSGTERRSGESV